MNISFEHVTAPTDDVRALVNELDADLRGYAEFDPCQHHGYSVDKIFAADMTFFVVRADGEAAGCCGVSFEDGFAELKRMYVRPRWRGKGLVQAMIERLEVEARARGYTRVTLETGDVLLPALNAYQRAGYTRCAVFGEYRMLDPFTIERSVFLEKYLVG